MLINILELGSETVLILQSTNQSIKLCLKHLSKKLKALQRKPEKALNLENDLGASTHSLDTKTSETLLRL